MTYRRQDSEKSLDIYTQEASRYQRLTREQEKNLGNCSLTGNTQARDSLVTSNLLFVISVAKRYQNRGLPLSELIAEGNIGLIKAAERYDPDFGVKFISYAKWEIKQSITRAINGQEGQFSVYTESKRRATRANTLIANYQTEGMNFSDAKEKALGEVKLKPQVYDAIQAIRIGSVSLDSPLKDEKNSFAQIQGENDSPEEHAQENDLEEKIQQALSTIKPREAEVIRHYFGLNGYESKTLDTIGDIMGVSRECIRQVRNQALEKLHDSPIMRSLMEREDFLRRSRQRAPSSTPIGL